MHKLWAGWLLLLLITLLFPGSPVQAQSPNLQLQSLLVELWPEYDRPEVLVIYRGQLDDQVPLPAQLTFRLPGRIEAMHAVAVEQDGGLVNVDPGAVQVRQEADTTLLTFPASARGFQFEYYDPNILTRQGQERRLTYTFTAPYPISSATFQLQEPIQTQSGTMSPEPTQTFTAENGLTYRVVQAGSLAAGQTFQFTASYTRSTDALTAQNLPPTPTEPPLDISVVSAPPVDQGLNLGYLLVGAGLILLLGAGGYWWWSRRLEAENQPQPRLPSPRSRLRRKKAGGGSSGQSDQTLRERPPADGFCYRCGTALREGAEFCHVCGARRRPE